MTALPEAEVSDVVWLYRRRTFSGESPAAPHKGPLIPGVTVVVCTFHRAQSLRRLLESIAAQDRTPECLIVVDASTDDESERLLREYPAPHLPAEEVLYARVSGSRRGLTRQRNFALRHVWTDLVAFFDDDIVLQPQCLREAERVHRHLAPTVIGVGAYIENQFTQPPWRWRLRAKARVVPSLEPGRYFRSGTSTPWSFLAPTERSVEGDWLPGGAAIWATELARDCGFNERFVRYCSGEDLEFSLRMKNKGRLVLAGSARVLHLREQSGRPDAFELGFTSVRNHHYIHCTCVSGRRWRDAAWFYYARLVDIVTQVLGLVRSERRARWAYLRGYVAGVVSVLIRPPAREGTPPAGRAG